MGEICDHSVGYLTSNFDSDEGIDSTYDLAMEFADDETLAIYGAHHDMAKTARTDLSRLAADLRARMEQLEQGGDN
ncbi:MAG TPA: hypothetical protein VLG13_00900 [Patescibacteria group bacterium]|nr:hypothetical protein [Patescibacteria group bacterium]